ncbi:MAG: RDD family protein [Candidatus Methanolliviera sp. GoM_asphalt]|nr:MAG: RDD family protein [Candidatus Methanolliviera sp. GoM_asphalt]
MADVIEEGIIEKAGVGRRFVSYLIDAIILVIVGAVLGLTGEIVGSVMSTAISVAYFTYLFGRGQTLGMMAMKIKLTRTDGTYPIGYTRGLLRYVGTIISALVIGIGYLWIVIDKDNQGWHDKIADTYVVPA